MNLRISYSVFLLAGLLSAAMLLAGCGKADSSPKQIGSSNPSEKQLYHCPMHTKYITDHPGNCPICGMMLVQIKKEEDIKPGNVTMVSMPGMNNTDTGTTPDNMETGRSEIYLSSVKRQITGMNTSVVERRNLSMDIHSTAVVEHDETRYAKIAPRLSGWIRALKVNFTGEPVEKGQPLFTAYSPELLTAENEYLISLRNHDSLKNSTDEGQREFAGLLLDSARKKLELFQVSDDEIKTLEQNKTPSDELLFKAPFSGHVTSKTAVEGKYFNAGESLYEIADLSHLWLRGTVFEYEMPLISAGQEVTVTFPYLGNKTIKSKITFIYPHIDASTRRGGIRIELDNTDRMLHPAMWADLEINIPLGVRLAIPSSAVIDTGKRFMAFVDSGNGYIDPRELKIGIRTDEYYEVLEGVKEGEHVVTRALFLIDSESQLKSAISAMNGHDGHGESGVTKGSSN